MSSAAVRNESWYLVGVAGIAVILLWKEIGAVLWEFEWGIIWTNQTLCDIRQSILRRRFSLRMDGGTLRQPCGRPAHQGRESIGDCRLLRDQWADAACIQQYELSVGVPGCWGRWDQWAQQRWVRPSPRAVPDTMHRFLLGLKKLDFPVARPALFSNRVALADTKRCDLSRSRDISCADCNCNSCWVWGFHTVSWSPKSYGWYGERGCSRSQ